MLGGEGTGVGGNGGTGGEKSAQALRRRGLEDALETFLCQQQQRLGGSLLVSELEDYCLDAIEMMSSQERQHVGQLYLLNTGDMELDSCSKAARFSCTFSTPGQGV